MADLDALFAALADPTRRAILARLAQGEASVTELTASFDLSQPAISRHLKVLETAGLISHGQAAQFRPRRLEPQALKPLADWIGPFSRLWEESFMQLDRFLASETPKTEGQDHER